PVSFHASVRSANAPLPELIGVANAFGAAEGMSGTGSLSLDARIEGKGSTMAYSGTVATGAASLSTSPSAKPMRVEAANVKLNSTIPLSGTIDAGKLLVDPFILTNLKSNFKLDNGILHLDPVTAGIFGGRIDGN